MQTHIELTHVADIQPGDTVEHYGELMTVCRSDIKLGGFMGTTLFGDSYRLGTQKVKRVVTSKAMPTKAVSEMETPTAACFAGDAA